MGRRRIAPLAILCLLASARLLAQQANPKKAQVLLAATIQALGGQRWLDLRTIRTEAAAATFFQGTPTGAMANVTITQALPDQQRVDLDKGKVVQIFTANRAWEITYKGKKPLAAEQAADDLRWHRHSLGAVLRGWARDPATVLVDQGQSLVDRQLADKIMLIRSGDDAVTSSDAVTLDLDAETHLPLRLSFRWRDPRFRDTNLDAIEYNNYQRIDGIATPFTLTWTHNGQVVRQRFVRRVEYNRPLPPDFFNPDAAAAHLK